MWVVDMRYTASMKWAVGKLFVTSAMFALAVFTCALGQSTRANTAEQFAAEAQAALAAGRYADAEKAFEKLRQLEPGVAEVHANLGLIYFEERKFEEAVPVLRQALKLKPTLTKTDNLLGMSLSELGRYAEALPRLEKCLRRSTDTEIKRMCGLELQRAYTGLKRDRNAVDVALELNRLYPDDPEILYQTGKIYGNFAFLTMWKLAQVAPNSVWRHLAAAEAQESQGSYDQAIQEYREVLRLEPGRSGIHYRIGRTLLSRYWQRHLPDDTAEAQKEFESELQSFPSNANAAYELGELHRRARQADEAEKYFGQAIEHYPDFAEAHLGLAAVLMEKKESEQALVHAQKAVAANPDNEVGWYRLAQIQKTLGNSAEQEKAIAEYRRLHDQFTRQKGFDPAGSAFSSPSEVTKQTADPSSDH
jgi:tetratricopeptide (TPR) repeat protein